MSKEEFLKIQTCVLKVNIHCDGCKQKVKKILQKIDGVFTTSIDAEQGKVMVSGNVDPAILIKKLAKSGKHAELWGASKAANNNHHQNQLANQLKNMQIDNGKGGNNNNKGQQQKGGSNNNQPKGGQPTHPQLTPQQLQQLQQMKGFQDLKLPPLKDLKMPPNNPNQKAVKFNLPDDEELSDDEFDDYDDDDFDDDEFYDEMDDLHQPLNKMKPIMGNGLQVPNIMMLNGMMNGNNPQLMNAQKSGNGGGNGKKGGGNGAVPVQVNMGENKSGNGGKKGGGGGGGTGGNNNQNQGGKNGGSKPQDAKNGNHGGGGGGAGNNNKNGNHANGGGNGNNVNPNGAKKGNNSGGAMHDGVHAMGNGFHNMGGARPNAGQMGNMSLPMGQMGNLPMSQMSNMPAVQGLPAAAMSGGGGGGTGYFQGAGPDPMPGNPYHQQQYLAAVMNQQRAMGNERFQPMMYARPPPAVNYMPQQPYPYPYPYGYPPHGDGYSNFFSDENTSSCNIM